MSFSNSIDNVNEIEIDLQKERVQPYKGNKTCSNCEYFHQPLNHCDFLYRDTTKNSTCYDFLNIII